MPDTPQHRMPEPVGPLPPVRSLKELDPETRRRLQQRARDIRAATGAVLDAIGPKLPPDRYASERQNHAAGEWFLMLNSVLATLVKQRIALNESDRDLIARTLAMIPDPGEHDDFLADPGTVLPALTVVDARGRRLSPPPDFDTDAFWPRRRAAHRWGRVGGHLAGAGVPHKAAFPPSWDAAKVDAVVLDVARNPDEVPERTRDGAWITRGHRDGVQVEVRLRPHGTIITGYPLHGAGVRTTDADGNPGDPLWS